MDNKQQKQSQANQKDNPQPIQKIGAGLLAEMVKRGRDELAQGLGLQGHNYGHDDIYSQDRGR